MTLTELSNDMVRLEASPGKVLTSDTGTYFLNIIIHRSFLDSVFEIDQPSGWLGPDEGPELDHLDIDGKLDELRYIFTQVNQFAQTVDNIIKEIEEMKSRISP